MDYPEDIPVGGEPQDGDDGYPKEKPFPSAPSDQPLPEEQKAEDDAAPTEDIDNAGIDEQDFAQEADDIQSQLEAESEGETEAEGADEESGEATNSDDAEADAGSIPKMTQDEHQVPEVPANKVAELPDITGETQQEEAPPPSEEEMGGIEDSLEFQGEKVNQFNEAGGAGGDYESGFSGDYGGDGDVSQFADSVANFAEKSGERLTEAIRRIDAMSEGIERERL
jgi:hypothetical protein